MDITKKLELKRKVYKNKAISEHDKEGLFKAIDKGIPEYILDSMIEQDRLYNRLISGHKIQLGSN